MDNTKSKSPEVKSPEALLKENHELRRRAERAEQELQAAQKGLDRTSTIADGAIELGATHQHLRDMAKDLAHAFRCFESGVTIPYGVLERARKASKVLA